MCLDPRALNKVIKQKFFQLAAVEDIFAQLPGVTVLSIFGANMGFYQIPLDGAKSKLCTFFNPFGQYMSKRLPFGIISVLKMFYKNFKQYFENLRQNLIVFGKKLQEHNLS